MNHHPDLTGVTPEGLFVGPIGRPFQKLFVLFSHPIVFPFARQRFTVQQTLRNSKYFLLRTPEPLER